MPRSEQPLPWPSCMNDPVALASALRKEKIRQVFWSVTEIRASMTFRLARIPASPCGFPRGFNKLDGLKAVLYRGLAGLVRGVIATLARSHSANPDLDVHGGASDC